MSFAFQHATACEHPQDKTGPTGQKQEVAGYELTFPALGTLVSFKAYGSDKSAVETAFDAARQRIVELEAILTDYDPASETRQLTLKAANSAVSVSADLWQVLVASDTWHQRSGGAFDASLGQLTSLWRKYRRARKVPGSSDIQRALESCGWQHVFLDKQNRTVQFDIQDLRLDFGAIGKGYIADEAFKVIIEAGVACCLVNISGNIRCGVSPPERPGWVIDVSPLEAEGKPLRRVTVAETAIATSGDLWQYSLIDGQRRSHILDPNSGIGVLGPVSASVVAPTAKTADALATIACIQDWQALEEMTGRIRRDGSEFSVLVARRDASGLSVQATASFPPDISDIVPQLKTGSNNIR